LICTPTLLSGTLIATLVFGPAWAVGGLWRACAVTLGVLAGYLAYAMTHHAMHHGRTRALWVRQRRRSHARHHHAAAPACYGVTSAFWDHVFGTAATTRQH
jgi:cyclopropane-fatty-acyl-phospholipid synthase